MLDIGNSGGNFTPWVKFNAKAGRWYVKGDNGDVEVTNPTFVADFQNIKTGWFYFSAGAAPERVLDPALTQRATKPDRTFTDKNGNVKDCFKRGFMLNCFSNNSFGGVVELSSTAESICTPIGALYGQYSNAPESKTGKLPVVAVKGASPVTGKHGTNYTPLFEIVKWVDRPVEFDGMESNHVAPQPVAAPAPAPVAASSSSEF